MRDKLNLRSDKFRGCLVGGAVGDALGSPVEFYYENQIFEKYGRAGITEYDLNQDHVAEITDDTQMTIFTTAGLLQLAPDAPVSEFVSKIWEYYQDWHITQTQRYSCAFRCLQHAKDLDIPELFHRRGPGYTCMTAIENGIPGTIEKPLNHSKGCGGVMRIAPIGLYFHGNPDKIHKTPHEIAMLGAQVASLTHGHELGYIPAAAQVYMIHRIIEEPDCDLTVIVTDAIAETQKLFPNARHLQEFVEIMEKAVWLAGTKFDDLTAIHAIGEGWVAEETLAIAVYCALRYPDDFEKAIIASVNHDGDSDSTGAVTGNLLGAYLGYEAIPEKFKINLELHDRIFSLADRLYQPEK